MNRNWKRWGALLMALVMALSLFPVSALAARREDDSIPAVPAVEREEAPAAKPAVSEDDDVPATLLAEEITATDSSRDIPVGNYTLDVDSSITDGSSGPKEKATDGNEGTWWHSNSTTPTGGHWISVELPEAKWVSAFRYKPRADYTKANANASSTVNGNGYVTSYRIEVSQNGTDWTPVASGNWAAFEEVSGRGSLPTGAWEVANFTPVKAKYVKLVGVTTAGNGNSNNAHMHAAEIRVVAAEPITASGTVSGRVVDVNGDGVQGATVTLAQDNVACTGVSGVTAATTDASGNYTLSWSLTDAAERNYRVRASLAGYGAALSDAVNFTGGGAKTANVTLTAITADESYAMTTTETTPAYTNGQNAAVSEESNGLRMTFSSSNRLNNLVRFTSITGTNTEVEFDATRSGSGAGGFGVALRHKTGIYIYAGQNTAGSGWCNESVNSGTTTQSEVVQGPSFASGETRHFKVQLQQSGGVAHVSLWIDGVAVMEEVPAGSDVTDLGALAFICGVPGTTVTVQNLYVTSHDEGYTITMPDTLTGYEVISATEVKALVAAEAVTAAEGTGTFKANPGDIINIYSATPLSKKMTAPLTVYKVEDNSVSSVENVLHITHTNSANKDLGYYVQFPMPAYNVTLTPSALEEVETKELKNVSILRSSGDDEIVNVGGTATLRATLTPAIGVEDLGVTWSSSNEAVATVDGAPNAELDTKGADAAYATVTVTGVSAGTATITVTTANGLTDTRQVTVGVAVEDVHFDSTTEVTLYTNGKTAEQKKTATLTASVEPSNATNQKLSWWSAEPEIATVNESGLVTAVASGTVRIYARSQQNPGAEAYRTVRVVTLPTGLTLDVNEAALTTDTGAANNTQVVVPTLLPADASNKTITWSTGNGDVAAVTKPWSNQNALITAVGVGTTTVTARSAADNTVTATVTVTVKATVTGDVSVSGKPAYNSVLTAETGAVIEGAKDGLTYQWYRVTENEDGETTEELIAGATTDTYTPAEADIGHALTVKVIPDPAGYYTGELTATTAVIGLEAGHEVDERNLTYVNCTTETSADGAIQGLLEGHVYQYQKQNDDETWPEEWDDVAGDAITGLTPGNYRIRHAGDETREPGEPSNTITIVVTGGAEKKLTIPHDFEGGDVRANRSQIPVGDMVTLTVEPDEGYELDTLTATYTDENDQEQTVEVTVRSDGKYTFRMPNAEVTIGATFKLKTYTIGHALTNITCSLGAEEDHTAQHGEAFSITLTPAAGYNMPSTLMVTTANGQRFTAYTYTVHPDDSAKRVLTFARGVTEDVTVTAEATLKTYPVEYDGANVTFAAAPARVGWHQILAVAVTADEGYELPETVTVTMNGGAVAYTYNKDTGAVYIAENVIEGSLSIVVNGEKSLVSLDKVSISGVARVGERLTTTITPAEADGHVAYQWYWVEGEGESATWTPIPGADGRSRVVTEQSINKFVGVKVTALDGQGFSGEVSSQTTGTVIDTTGEELLPTQVQIVRERVSIEVGASETLTAYVGPSTATNKTVRWSSSDDSVVTVENGVITGVAPGRATITVTAVADETVKDTCVVTVTEPPVIEAEAKDILVPYDGLPHGIAVAVTKPADGGARVQYSRNGSTFGNSNPTFSAVGEYVVWYKVTASGLPDLVGQAKVTIEKAKPAVKLTADRTSLSGAGEVTLTVTLPDYVNEAGLSLDASDQTLPVTKNGDGTYTVSVPGGTKTYTFTARLMGTDDYESVTATCTVKVGVSSSTTRPTTTTETKEDGTKVTTETKPDGTKVETVEEPDGTKSVTETKPDGSKIATVEQPDGTTSETVVTAEGDATITVTDPEGEELAKVEIPATIPEPEDKFVDIDQTPWAEEAINNVAALKLVNGIGGNKYDPTTPMTRGALATVLHRLSNGKTDYEVAFKDVAQGRYYTEGVAWAAKANVVKGVSQDIFAPDQIITREQLAVMLARYAKLIGMSTKADTKSLDQFTDGDTTGAWAVDGMAWCVEKGILKGKGLNNLDPTANVSRAEVAVMLDRFIALIQK